MTRGDMVNKKLTVSQNSPDSLFRPIIDCLF